MPSSEPLLRLSHATVTKNGTRVLDDLSLEIAAGEHTAIFGPNGSGKSSLIKLITRQHYPLARPGGEPSVSVFGRARWDIFSLRKLLGIVSAEVQQGFVEDPDLLGREIVLSGFFAGHGLAAHHAVSPEMERLADAALHLAQAGHLAQKPAAQMSTGEARRILIARALAPGPKALLLDEPTAGLDLAARRRFLDTLREIARAGRTLILVTHHAEEVLPEIGRVILLQSGKVFRDGRTEDVLTSANLSALFGEPVQVRRRDGVYSAESISSEEVNFTMPSALLRIC